MSMNLNGINLGGFGGYTLLDQLQYNLKFWLDGAFVENGAYTIYSFDQDSYFADNESKLVPVADERYPESTVWEGAARSWVWESGLNLSSGLTPVFRVSGVYIDGVFYDKTSYPHHVDYLNGRIIFEEPPSSGSDIRAEFCARDVYVGFSDDPEFRLLMLEAVEEFLTRTTPSSTPIREHQLWMPCVFIDVENGFGRGLQLGGGQIKTRYITLHIFADNAHDRNLLMDWLDFNNRKTFFMADLNELTLPFDEWGDVLDDTTNWKDLVSSYQFKKLRIVGGNCKKINSLNTKIFRAKVVWEVEIDVGSI